VVDVRISVVIVTNAKVARSEIRFASTTTMALVITTLYTLIPMYCESLRAGIFTCLKKNLKKNKNVINLYISPVSDVNKAW
jgi:hypothetical protein